MKWSSTISGESIVMMGNLWDLADLFLHERVGSWSQGRSRNEMRLRWQHGGLPYDAVLFCKSPDENGVDRIEAEDPLLIWTIYRLLIDPKLGRETDWSDLGWNDERSVE